MDNNFIDYVKFYARSGSGGAGIVHFRKEKFAPKGGPDGGDGGDGGHIILRGNSQRWTLLHLKFKKHIIAPNGQNGMDSNKHGSNGKHIVLDVPLGTVAKDAETGEVLLEVLEHGEKKILLNGGKGGLGNTHFKNSVNQTPRYSQKGIPGIEKFIILELKVLADVGLVGFPNAGKSTLLSIISAAKPKIGNYPFTTLTPNLGVVGFKSEHSFVVADIPGIIEGAAEGAGLGIRFLRHIERNSILSFLVPIDVNDIKKEYDILLNECKKYNIELLNKKRVLTITKTDLADDELIRDIKKEVKKQLPAVTTVFISSVTQKGIEDWKKTIWETLQSNLP